MKNGPPVLRMWSTPCWVALMQAATSIPSTASVATLYDAALTVRSVCDWARCNAVPMAYRLFSHRNSTGNFHSAAMFSDS